MASGEIWAIIYGADEEDHRGLNDPLLFRETLARVAKVVSKKRIVVAMSPDVRSRWTPELRSLAPQNCIEAPYERGTPASALLAFFHLFRKEPTSRVLVIPANHRVADERTFLVALEAAAAATPGDDNRVVMLGMREKDPMLPGELIQPSEACEAHASSTHRVVRLDPTTELEERRFAFERGALMSSGVLAAGSSAMLRLYEHALPGMLRSFLASLRGHAVWAPETLGRLFRFLPKKHLGLDLLQPSSELLRVLPVQACGYSNLECGDRLALRALRTNGRRGSLALLPS